MITIDRLLYLLKDANESSWINIYSVDIIGNTIKVVTDNEIDENNEKIPFLKEDLESEVSWRKELQKEIEEKTEQINELEKDLSKFDSEGLTVKEVLSQNNELIKTIAELRKNSLDLQRENVRLRKRKNNAKIISLNPLIVEYKEIKYKTTKHE